MIKLILVESHSIVRNGIKTMLEKEPDMQVVGEAGNAREVLGMLKEGIKADIVLTDISMPEMDGMQLSAALKESHPLTHTVIFSMIDNEQSILKAFSIGVKGYLLKNTTIEEMLFAIRSIVEGKRIICTELSMKMLDQALIDHNNVSLASENSKFSEREFEILKLIAEGHTSQEIADKTFISRRTVEGHRLSLIEKTGVRNTAQLIKFACKAKWV